MAIDDLDTGMKPADQGGTELDSFGAEIDVVAAVKAVKTVKKKGWFWRFVGGAKTEVPMERPAKSWLEQKEERNAEKADEAMSRTTNESESQVELRKRLREGL